MSEFQRFVTYINLYDKNIKVRNVGFAKIERRNDQCKMEIHMRGTGYTGISCPVYLFVRDGETMQGIPIGKISMQSGTGDCGLTLDASNLEESGYDLKQAGGLMIFVNEKIMFASQWDDKEIQRERFVPFEKKEKQEKQEQQEPVNRQDMGRNRNNPNQDTRKSRETSKEIQQEECTILPEEEAVISAAESSIKATEAAAMLKNPEWFQSVSRPLNPEHNKKDAGHLREEQPGRQTRPQEEEQPWAEKWQFILENYPVLTPFEGEETILCVRIELKDIRMLPKRYWYLGNNSFLLHGFFNYRYLVLGAMEQEGKKRWFLGVPGVFQSQEKVMAAIFGFPEYKCEKVSEQKTGQFGYWYRFMDE